MKNNKQVHHYCNEAINHNPQEAKYYIHIGIDDHFFFDVVADAFLAEDKFQDARNIINKGLEQNQQSQEVSSFSCSIHELVECQITRNQCRREA